ncbi:MAG: alpha/beta fold hydrolase [Bacteroidota bacterium]|nr:alpha/beta fold hydrolase [Bacteroidota bacterium]
MELFFRSYGEGQPIIILHGILGISDNWVTFGKRLAENNYRVIIPDQRNHGHSPHSHAFNYYALVDDLAEFVDEHKLENPIIIGHSMGGKVVMRYTLENPGIVSRIIIVDVSLRTYVNHTHHQQLIRAMLDIDLVKYRNRKDVASTLSETVSSERIRQFLLKNLFWKDKDKLGWRLNLESLYENLESMYDGVYFSTRFDGPALFIRGAQSGYVSDDDHRAIFGSFPKAEIKSIENGTHWVHADEPEKFYQLVIDFLTKH